MKILIADDEDYTREGLIDSIDWESFGIDEIMQAVNGQYLSSYRLERAKRMLKKDLDKITEISEKCGYANGNYFAMVFKEATVVSDNEGSAESKTSVWRILRSVQVTGRSCL